MKRLCLLVFLVSTAHAETPLYSMTSVDRLEYLDGDAVLVDADGWVGRDLNKLIWKLEGESGDEDDGTHGRGLTGRERAGGRGAGPARARRTGPDVSRNG